MSGNCSRKPGGRGMGLHISRESLARIGLGLTLDDSGPRGGATFRITPIKAQLEQGEAPADESAG
jgi:hypothetical protein